jgi:orotidine-5'-phosphate decarboxylase
MNASDRLIVTLDFENAASAARLVEQLGPSAQFYKVEAAAAR